MTGCVPIKLHLWTQIGDFLLIFHVTKYYSSFNFFQALKSKNRPQLIGCTKIGGGPNLAHKTHFLSQNLQTRGPLASLVHMCILFDI